MVPTRPGFRNVARFKTRFDSTVVRMSLLRHLYGDVQDPSQIVAWFMQTRWVLFEHLTPPITESEAIATIVELLSPRLRVYTKGLKFASIQGLFEMMFAVESDVMEIFHSENCPQQRQQQPQAQPEPSAGPSNT